MANNRATRAFITAGLAAGIAIAAWGAPTTPPPPPSSAYLGVTVESVPAQMASAMHSTNGGAAIAMVDQDGPACQAGVKSGDVVTAFNGKPVSGPEQLANLIHATKPGTLVTLTVWRSGNSQEMKVKLGDRKQLAAVPMGAMTVRPLSPVGTIAPAPPLPPAALVEVPGYSPLLARSGILVEPLSPQLCDYFAVPQNQGVLVRSVDRGSPGANAGLKAGDVVVTANNETIHDMQDWKRALKVPGGHVTLSVVRDKKPVTLVLVLPASTSKLSGKDGAAFEDEMDALDAEMEMLAPELERESEELATLAQLDPQQMDQLQRDAAAAAALTPEMEKQIKELSQQAEQMRKQAEKAASQVTPEMRKQAEAMGKQAEVLRKESEKMQKEIEKLAPELERQAEEMARSMQPAIQEWVIQAHDMEQQWKQMQPELEKQMQEFKKQWQQEMREWQKALQEGLPKQM